MNKKAIMQKAVRLAKRMLGDWQARMKMALKMAWAIAKRVQFELKDGRTSWIAKIVGKHPKFKLDRKFINDYEIDSWGDRIYQLEEGYYHFNNGKEKGYVKIENGTWKDVEYAEVLASVA